MKRERDNRNNFKDSTSVVLIIHGRKKRDERYELGTVEDLRGRVVLVLTNLLYIVRRIGMMVGRNMICAGQRIWRTWPKGWEM